MENWSWKNYQQLKFMLWAVVSTRFSPHPNSPKGNGVCDVEKSLSSVWTGISVLDMSFQVLV